MPKPILTISTNRLFLVLLILVTVLPCIVAGQDAPDPNTPGSDSTPAQVADTEENTEEKKQVAPPDLSNPRATMRTFLVAIEAAAGDRPEAIDKALQCMDLSQLKEDDATLTASKLAARLRDLIDFQGVKLEDIPESLDSTRTQYVFYEHKPEGNTESLQDAPPPAITLAINSEGQWLFTAHTLTSIPKLEESFRKTAKVEENPETDVPAVRRSARATMETFLSAMRSDPQDMDQALLCLNPSGRDPAAWTVTGPELAVKLKTVMDKESRVVLTEIPDDPNGPPIEWFTSRTGNIVLDRVEIVHAEAAENHFGLVAGEWRFTPQTLRTISALYDERIDVAIVKELQEEGVKEVLTATEWLRRQAPESMRQKLWTLEYWQWLALALILPLGGVIQFLISWISGGILGLWLGRRRFSIERAARKRLSRKIGTFVAVLVWYYLIPILGFPEVLLAILIRASEFALVISLLLVGYRAVDIIGGHVASNRDVRLTHFDDILIPLLQKILRVVVFLIVVLFVLSWMGQPPKTVLGALGIGGVALAFAAQDTISNFFGSITVLFDRPFGIGDWIVIGDVEGTVEHVGFRSTRVRTFYNSVVTMPNSKMVNTQVDNYGARHFRRTKSMISVTYDTSPEKIEAFCEGIRELIRLHPYTRKDYYHVYFNKFESSSLDIMLYMFFEVPDWGTELRERHNLFLDIVKLAKRLDVEFAFPTQTLWLNRQSAPSPDQREQQQSRLAGGPKDAGVEEAAMLFEQAHGPYPVERNPVRIDPLPASRPTDNKTE